MNMQITIINKYATSYNIQPTQRSLRYNSSPIQSYDNLLHSPLIQYTPKQNIYESTNTFRKNKPLTIQQNDYLQFKTHNNVFNHTQMLHQNLDLSINGKFAGGYPQTSQIRYQDALKRIHIQQPVKVLSQSLMIKSLTHPQKQEAFQ